MDYSDSGSDDDYSIGSVNSLAAPIPGTDESGRTTSSTGQNDLKDDDPNSPFAIVRKKGRAVNCTKFVMLLLLLGAGIALSVAAYMTSKPDEEDGEAEEEEEDDESTKYAAIVGGTFALLILVFMRYDYLVTRRNSMVMDMANRSKKIVDSLFPSMVRDRLMQDASASPGDADPEQPDDVAKMTLLILLASLHGALSVSLRKSLLC
jgi:hypothetical protein